jgi:hypothetical protein
VVKVRADLPRAPRPHVPEAALIVRGDDTLVAVLDRGHARLVPVLAGAIDGKSVEILRGLEGGERVVLDAATLADGAAVQAADAPQTH